MCESPGSLSEVHTFNRAVDECSDLVGSICFTFAGKGVELDDLKQEAWLNIWKGISKYHGECRLSTWIYRVTFNSCISSLRSRALRGSEHDDISDMAYRIAEDPSDREDIEYLHSLIARLGPLDKALITMWLDDQSYEDIAYVNGLSRNVVATRIHRIKEKLTKMHNEGV